MQKGPLTSSFWQRPRECPREDSNLRTRLRRPSSIVFSLCRVPCTMAEMVFSSTGSTRIDEMVVGRLTIRLTIGANVEKRVWTVEEAGLSRRFHQAGGWEQR